MAKDSVLSQQEIDNLLNPNFNPSPSIDGDTFSDDLEASLKEIEIAKKVAYKQPIMKSPTINLSTILNNDRKMKDEYICGGCKKRMKHIYIYRPGGNGKVLHAWCEACNFYSPI